MKTTRVETKTSAGDPLMVESIEAGDMVQMNVYLPPGGGSGYFVLFPKGEHDKALAAAVRLADGAPYEGSEDITDRVDGALSAWLMPQPNFSVRSDG